MGRKREKKKKLEMEKSTLFLRRGREPGQALDGKNNKALEC